MSFSRPIFSEYHVYSRAGAHFKGVKQGEISDCHIFYCHIARKASLLWNLLVWIWRFFRILNQILFQCYFFANHEKIHIIDL